MELIIDNSPADDSDLFKEIFERIVISNRRKLPILKSAAPSDCRKCGACCAHYERVDIGFDDPNYSWLRDNDLIENAQSDAAMKMKDDRCIALTGTVGKDAQCSIYDHRPEGCREYIPGAARCRTVIMFDLFKCVQ